MLADSRACVTCSVFGTTGSRAASPERRASSPTTMVVEEKAKALGQEDPEAMFKMKRRPSASGLMGQDTCLLARSESANERLLRIKPRPKSSLSLSRASCNDPTAAPLGADHANPRPAGLSRTPSGLMLGINYQPVGTAGANSAAGTDNDYAAANDDEENFEARLKRFRKSKVYLDVF